LMALTGQAPNGPKFVDVPLPPTRPGTPQPQQIAMLTPLPPKRTVFDGTETTGSLRASTAALPKAIAGSRTATGTPSAALAYAAPVTIPPKSATTSKSAQSAKAMTPKLVPTSLTMTSAMTDSKVASGFTKSNSTLPQGKFAKLPLPTDGGFSN
jgi:hypothetical protein